MQSVETVGHLVAEGQGTLQIPVTVTYDPRSCPFSLEMTFHSEAAVTWVFARELITNPSLSVPGADLFISVSGAYADSLLLRLSSPNGTAIVAVPRADLEQFVAATFEHVPAGTEMTWVNIDDVVTGLLAAE